MSCDPARTPWFTISGWAHWKASIPIRSSTPPFTASRTRTSCDPARTLSFTISGWAQLEGRDPHPLFDTSFYCERNPDAASRPARIPSCTISESARRWDVDPHPLFDSSYYRRTNPARARTEESSRSCTTSRRALAERRNPHPLFNTAFYCERNPDVGRDPARILSYTISARVRPVAPILIRSSTHSTTARGMRTARPGINPLLHYLSHGAAERRDPHPLFETSFYLEQKPHVAALGVNPLAHFLAEGPTPAFDPLSSPRPLPDTAICIVTPDIVGPVKNGGIGTACYHFARLLAEGGHPVTILFTVDLSPCRLAHWRNTYARMGIKFLSLSDTPPVTHHVHGSNWFLERSWRVFKYLEREVLLRRPLPGLARERILVDQGEAARPRLRPDHADRHDALLHEVARRGDAAVRPRADRDGEAGVGGDVRDRALRRAPEPHPLHARLAVAERRPRLRSRCS